MNYSTFEISALWHWIERLFVYQADSPLMMGSIPFALLFIFFLAIYTLLKSYSRTAMMMYVICFSLFFAYKVNGMVMWMLPLTACINYAVTQEMRLHEGKARKALLTFVVLVDLALLCYFKYTNFIIGDVVNEMFSTNFSLQSIALPVGISFYTFQAISYAVDTYKRKFDMEVTLLEYCFYLTFFPLLMAGPITRAANLIPRLKRNEQASSRMLWTGLFLIMLGLVKKNMLSDYIAQFNNWVFDAPQTFSGFENLAALFGYPVQIFLDFSGYSDMSIGVAAILGFYLPDNFYFPYRSLSVTEFWRRWHISLSFWFRDYVYIPLGGNRKGKVRMYFNNFLTMLVAGLWHGSSWMFVIWGALHGFGLVVQSSSAVSWVSAFLVRWWAIVSAGSSPIYIYALRGLFSVPRIWVCWGRCMIRWQMISVSIIWCLSFMPVLPGRFASSVSCRAISLPSVSITVFRRGSSFCLG